MCEKCNRPFPTKWKQCPDCKPKQTMNYKQVHSKIKIPSRYCKAYNGAFTAPETNLISDFSECKIDSIFFTGATGTGKTFLATALMQEHCKITGLGGIWTTAGLILQSIRATYASKSKTTEHEIITGYSTCPVLLIDDLGAEKITDWSTSSLYEIISDRVNWCRQTIITSNLLLSGIAEWNPRMASRLASFSVIEMSGRDRRLPEQE